jgi:protease II
VVSSFDGHYVALGLSSGGAEYSEIRILDVERRRFLPESTDLKSLDIRLNRKTRLHRLGTEVGDDRDFFSNESSPDLGITARERPIAYVSKYIPDYILGKVATVQNEMRIFYAPISQLNTPKIEWKALCKPSDKLVRGLTILGDQVYAVTHDRAPRYKVVRTSLKSPDWENAETILPEGPDTIIWDTAPMAPERPDLFGAAVCNVGCANALRLEFTPNGPVNTPEFGTVDDPAQCKALYEMDGVQHVRKGIKYPAVLGVGGWNDPRVPVWQSGKFIPALQRANGSGSPALMKVNYNSGHFSEEKFATFNDVASQYAFLLWQTGHKEFQPVP